MDSNPAFGSLLELARAASQGNNFYEAERYYTKLLEIDPSFAEAWIGKGQACGMQSTASNLRISESMVAFGRAISSSPPGERDKTEGLCIRLASKIAIESFSICYDYILGYYNTSYVRGRDAWYRFFEKATLLIDSLEEMSAWSPDWAIAYEMIESISRKVLEGIPYMSEGGQRCYVPEGQNKVLMDEKYNLAVSTLQRLSPGYQPQPILPQKEAALCFVVTAAAGDPSHPSVIYLRKFRDQRMLKRSFGRKVIALYGIVGPPIANVISLNLFLRKLAYWSVVCPAISFLKFVYLPARSVSLKDQRPSSPPSI